MFLLVRLLPEFVDPKNEDVYAIGSRLDESCAIAAIKDLAAEHMVSWALRYVEFKEFMLMYSPDQHDESDYRMAEDVTSEAKRMYLNTEDVKRLLDAVSSGRYSHSPRAIAAVFKILYDMAWEGIIEKHKASREK
jgi:ribosomal protein S20